MKESLIQTTSEVFQHHSQTTPAYSLWSNSLCEKHNHMLAETVLKVKEDKKM